MNLHSKKFDGSTLELSVNNAICFVFIVKMIRIYRLKGLRVIRFSDSPPRVYQSQWAVHPQSLNLSRSSSTSSSSQSSSLQQSTSSPPRFMYSHLRFLNSHLPSPDSPPQSSRRTRQSLNISRSVSNSLRFLKSHLPYMNIPLWSSRRTRHRHWVWRDHRAKLRCSVTVVHNYRGRMFRDHGD